MQCGESVKCLNTIKQCMVKGFYMKSYVRIIAAIAVVALSACSKKSASSNSPQQGASAPTSKQPAESQAPGSGTPSAKAGEVVDLSESASSSDVTVKRLEFGGYTMDVLDPNPKGGGAKQSGSLILALCVPRINSENISSLADAAYPIVLSEGSQILMHRDQSYIFGDGTSARSAPPFALMTCARSNATENSVELNSETSVAVKSLKVGQSTMEVLSPNLKGVAAQQPGNLILVACAPRITDSNLKDVGQAQFPITLSEGSQLFMKRDTAYQFGDGSNASKLKAGVVITCEK